MKAVGIDIGTTNIGLVAVDLDTAQVAEWLSSPNTRIPSQDGFSYLQDPETIAATAEELLSRLPMSVSSIGITGQVHGILYLDKQGGVLSSRYTWLDRRGAEQIDGVVPRELLLVRCGSTMPNGYGLLTHYANRMMDLVPVGAARITGICEYVTERILGSPLDKTDESCLASFGGWDHLSGRHDPELLAEILPAGSPASVAAGNPCGSKRASTGNAVRKNPLLVESLQRQFGLDTMVPDIDNAAAAGSALVGAVAAGIITLEERVPLLKRLLCKSG